MAHLQLSPKLVNLWTTLIELKALNIEYVTTRDVAEFFGHPNLPASTVDPIILNHEKQPPGEVAKPTEFFYRYLQNIVGSPRGSEITVSPVESFIFYLLGLLDFDKSDLLKQRPEISLKMCHQSIFAQPNIVLMDQDYKLVVQEGKGAFHVTDYPYEPYAPLIGAAIAAAYENDKRRTAAGTKRLEEQMIYGIVMFNSAPTFWKIPVTTTLIDAVATGRHPLEKTTAQRFFPPVPNSGTYLKDGMYTLESRRVVLQCFEAFKQMMMGYN